MDTGNIFILFCIACFLLPFVFIFVTYFLPIVVTFLVIIAIPLGAIFLIIWIMRMLFGGKKGN